MSVRDELYINELHTQIDVFEKKLDAIRSYCVRLEDSENGIYTGNQVRDIGSFILELMTDEL